jgi:hypothetical protein
MFRLKNINLSSKFVFSFFHLILYFLSVFFRSTDVVRAFFLIETVLRNCFCEIFDLLLRIENAAIFMSVYREICWVVIITSNNRVKRELKIIKYVSLSQLLTRNVVTVNYVDAWIKWWMIFIKWLHNVLYK